MEDPRGMNYFLQPSEVSSPRLDQQQSPQRAAPINCPAWRPDQPLTVPQTLAQPNPNPNPEATFAGHRNTSQISRAQSPPHSTTYDPVHANSTPWFSQHYGVQWGPSVALPPHGHHQYHHNRGPSSDIFNFSTSGSSSTNSPTLPFPEHPYSTYPHAFRQPALSRFSSHPLAYPPYQPDRTPPPHPTAGLHLPALNPHHNQLPLPIPSIPTEFVRGRTAHPTQGATMSSGESSPVAPGVGTPALELSGILNLATPRSTGSISSTGATGSRSNASPMGELGEASIPENSGLRRQRMRPHPHAPDYDSEEAERDEDELRMTDQYLGAERDLRVHQIIRGQMASNKRVASKKALASLQSVDIDSLTEGERTCVICYNEFGVENPEGVNEAPLRLPKCKHVFGDHCIKKWFEESDSCPYCRDKVHSEIAMPKTPTVQAYIRSDFNLTRMPRVPGRASGSRSTDANVGRPRDDENSALRVWPTGDRRPANVDLQETRRRSRMRASLSRMPMTGPAANNRAPGFLANPLSTTTQPPFSHERYAGSARPPHHSPTTSGSGASTDYGNVSFAPLESMMTSGRGPLSTTPYFGFESGMGMSYYSSNPTAHAVPNAPWEPQTGMAPSNFPQGRTLPPMTTYDSSNRPRPYPSHRQ